MTPRLLLVLLMVLVSALVSSAGSASAQTTCVVDNTSDADAGTPPVANSLNDCLRRVGPGDTIVFDPDVFDLVNSDAATTIRVRGSLPALDDGNVTIDASDRRVTLDGKGAGAANGLTVSSAGNTIRGLTIVGFSGDGIQISGASNVVGGDRTVGTGPNGQGLRLAGNGAFGIEIAGAGSSANVVKGCWIGLDASGSAPQSNLAGVAIQGGAHDNTLGGVLAGEANAVSGNTNEGVTIGDAGSDGNVVLGNVVGAAALVTSGRARAAVANGSAGIFISRGTTGTQVGGTGAGEGNDIGFNGGNGVEVRATASTRNSVRGNKIYKNKGKGIALFDGSNDGVTKPQIGLANVPNTGTGAARYRIGGSTAQPGTVEVFSDSGSQGETLLGRGSVAGGAFTFEVDAAPPDVNLTATFTDTSGNTSEFGVFGLTDDDSDDDGVSDQLEQLAGTDPANPASTPATVGFALAGKLQVKLSFAKAGADAISLKTSLALPAPFVLDGTTVGFAVAGHGEKLVLGAKGKAATDTVSIAVTLPKNKTPIIKGGVKKSSLQADVAPSGLSDRTTAKKGEGVVVPVAVTTSPAGGSTDQPTVYFGAVQVTYKATQGKTGKAK